MIEYKSFLKEILETGSYRADRTGTGCISKFGMRLEFDLKKGFPLVTTKRVHMKSVVAELLWFLSGSTNEKDLSDMGCSIWKEWAAPDGKLGPIYGSQWRTWGNRGHDQIACLVDSLKRDEFSRRHIVSAWNVEDLYAMALPPCHVMFQCYSSCGELDLQIYQRSADAFLGVPFNIASYALLVHLLAAQTGLNPGRLIWIGGDCHIYSNHVEQVELQLTREQLLLPKLFLRDAKDIFSYKPDDVIIQDYKHHPSIHGDVAV